MVKLKISPSLTGTPLTEQELKSIIGGKINYTRECYCDIYQNYELISTSIPVPAQNEDNCIAQCNSLCRYDRTDCSSAQAIYFVKS